MLALLVLTAFVRRLSKETAEAETDLFEALAAEREEDSENE